MVNHVIHGNNLRELAFEYKQIMNKVCRLRLYELEDFLNTRLVWLSFSNMYLR